MNRTMRVPVSRWETFWRRVRNTFRTVFTRGDLTTLVITCLLMVVPVLGLSTSLDLTRDLAGQNYGWRASLTQLIPIAILSVLFGFLLSRSHYSEAFALILSGIYSVAVIGAVQVFAAPGNIVDRVMAVLTRFFDTLMLSLDRGVLDPYLLVLFLSVLIWFLGHNTAWHTFRLDRVWRAILPPGIVLALNGFYSQEDRSGIDTYLIIYLFLSLLLIIRSHIEAREFDWYLNRVSYQGNWRKLRAWFFRSGAIIGLIMLAFAWLAPTGSPEENAKRFQEFLKGDVMQNVTQLLNKLFGSLEGNGIASADYYGGDTLTLGGALELGDQIVMVVKAPPGPRYYWKSRVFDKYQANTWEAPRQENIIAETPGLTLNYSPVDPDTRKTISQEFTFITGTSSLLYAAPQPVTFDVPVFVEVDYIDRAQQTVNPGVTRQLVRLKEGESYNVTSSISTATADYLRTIAPTVPPWLRNALQLPQISGRINSLAVQIVNQAGARNNYDKAKAIEQWLRNNIKYNEKIINPPTDRELVDWLLFDQREGYCTYYASAMIVMLRSLGIPARMAAGFSQGVYDPANGTFIVRERDAHTWVEVWFGNAGWIEFEPTSAQETVDRTDSNAQPTTPPPPPTNTPAPTPTPLPTVTPPPGAVAPAQSPTPPPPQVTATLTPSPPPTNTPAPTPTPTRTSPLPELPRNVQNTLGILLAIAAVIALLSFMLVGFIWWVEYRGLDELSPIGRAYARLAIYARWLGIPLAEANTPLERSRRITKDVPEGNPPVTAITDMYIHERYARPRTNSIREEDSAYNAWKRARRAFIWKKIRRWFGRDKSTE